MNCIMQRKLVSAIITTHNRSSQYVLRAINSVLRQSYDNIEIIVVDDSTNNFSQRSEVEHVIRQCSKDIIYIKHRNNKGACAARNTGLMVSKGYYVAFLDDDDEWLPSKIEEQVKGFSDNSIAMVYAGFIVIDETINKKYISSNDYKKGYVFTSLLKNNFVGNTSNPLIKKECIDKVGFFDVKMQSAQEYDLWLRIAMRYPVNHIKKPLLYYYIHNDKRISTDVDKKIAGFERINDKYNYFIEDDDETWYMRHKVLIPLYVKKGWDKKAYSLWYKCVKKFPLNIFKNFKLFLIIFFGFNSLVYRIYHKTKYGLTKEQRNETYWC